MKAAKEFKKDLLTHLSNPKAAIAYLNEALLDGDPRVFLVALRDVAEAHGNISQLAKQCTVKRESFYKMTSQKGNPSLVNIINIIKCLGLQFKIEKNQKWTSPPLC